LTLADDETDRLLRRAAERSFEIVGEALVRIERDDPATAERISNHRKIIGLRNRLAPGYGKTDHALMWEFIEVFLPRLRLETMALLAEADAMAGEPGGVDQ
jgi:uncharacterized protein with HEPN domain